MKGILWVLLFAVSSAVPLHAAEQIRVAVFEYPLIYQNGAEKGTALELVMEAFKTVNLEAEFEFLPVERMVRAVSEGAALCGVGGKVLFEAPKVVSGVVFSDTLQYVTQVFIYDTRRFTPSLEALSGMAGYRIGLLQGSGIHRILEKTDGLVLDANTTHEGTARQLYLRRVDVWAIVDITGMWYLRTLFPHEAAFYRSTRAFNRGDVSVFFSKARDPDGVYSEKFRKGLANIKQNGTYRDVLAKYYGGVAQINWDSATDDMRPLLPSAGALSERGAGRE